MIRANLQTNGGELQLVSHASSSTNTSITAVEGRYYMLFQNRNSVPTGGHLCTGGGTIVGNFTGEDTYSGRSCVCELVLATSNVLTLVGDYVFYAEYELA